MGRRRLGASNSRNVLAHRAAVTVALWRDLGAELAVHHADGDPSNNRLGNLQVLTHAEHNRQHRSGECVRFSLCPVCWRLFCWRRHREERVLLLECSCAAVSATFVKRHRGRTRERAAARKARVDVKSFSSYLAGAPVPPPIREPETPEPITRHLAI